MKAVSAVRHLGQKEKALAITVFKNTIPYDKVLISDGLGMSDRPFTMPTSMPATIFFNVSSSLGKYVIHSGDGYTGMSYRQEDKELLIHELTHVWQGEHSKRSWDYVFSSMWSQALTPNAYAYDKTEYKFWDDYNPEQQASIVEDWFADGMKEKEEEDIRFYYIKKHIRGEAMSEDWIRKQWVVKPLPTSTLDVDIHWDYHDAQLLPLLKQRFNQNDVAGYGKRLRQLEGIFRSIQPRQARSMLERLKTRRVNDEVVKYFYEHLSQKTRENLLEILRKTVSR
ncbi:MAG: hypothetical protein AB1757_21605 [Acidobacteriota bacterium]